MLGLSLLPVHANYPCNLRPPPSEPNTPNGNSHNPSSTTQHLTTQCPTPSMWIRPMPPGPPTEALPHQFPSQLMQLFPNTTIVPKQILTIAL